MASRQPSRKTSAVSQVLQSLTDQIKYGIYPPGSRLPPENQLAERFHASRATIRSALDKLAERDLIVRRQGDGTYVTRLSSLSNPLNQFIDVRQRIRDYGFEPGFITLHVGTHEANAKVARLLNVPPGSQVLQVHKLFTANDSPIIYVVNHIPLWVYQDHLTLEEIAQPGFTEPFFDLFAARCKQPVKYYTSSVRAEVVGGVKLPAELSHLDATMPILVSEDVGYNQGEKPVFYSVEHILTNSIDIQIVHRVDIY